LVLLINGIGVSRQKKEKKYDLNFFTLVTVEYGGFEKNILGDLAGEKVRGPVITIKFKV